MGDSGLKLSQGCHLFRLDELKLRLFQVSKDQAEQRCDRKRDCHRGNQIKRQIRLKDKDRHYRCQRDDKCENLPDEEIFGRYLCKWLEGLSRSEGKEHYPRQVRNY